MDTFIPIYSFKNNLKASLVLLKINNSTPDITASDNPTIG